MFEDNFLATSAIESQENSINFLSAGRIGIVNLSLAPNYSGRALGRPVLKTQYCPSSTARCDLLVAIFVKLKILRLFAARIDLVNNRGLTSMKTQRTTETRETIGLH